MNAATRVDLIDLLAPTREDPLWEAEKSGWRCFVMGNDRCHYRRGSKLRTALQSCYDTASRSADPVGGML